MSNKKLTGLPETPRFEIRRRLGAGGMGVVYEAFDRDRNDIVALKTILELDASTLYRFKNEFRALAKRRSSEPGQTLRAFFGGATTGSSRWS